MATMADTDKVGKDTRWQQWPTKDGSQWKEAARASADQRWLRWLPRKRDCSGGGDGVYGRKAMMTMDHGSKGGQMRGDNSDGHDIRQQQQEGEATTTVVHEWNRQ
jgi:hypothetical protein